jgi:hypothetical protein
LSALFSAALLPLVAATSEGKVAKMKLGKLSRREPSDEDFQTVLTLLESPDVTDMVAAILGAALVEYVLEEVIKLMFKQNSAEAWERMIDISGPLRDFHAKILTGFSLGAFNDDIRANLNLVRQVRNAFAHSRLYLRFNNPAVANALAAARPITSGKRQLDSAPLSLGSGKRAYLQLCFSLLTFFQIKLRTRLRRYERRVRDLRDERELLHKLLHSLKSDQTKRPR